jgi:hypothetical protein
LTDAARPQSQRARDGAELEKWRRPAVQLLFTAAAALVVIQVLPFPRLYRELARGRITRDELMWQTLPRLATLARGAVLLWAVVLLRAPLIDLSIRLESSPAQLDAALARLGPLSHLQRAARLAFIGVAALAITGLTTAPLHRRLLWSTLFAFFLADALEWLLAGKIRAVLRRVRADAR